MAVLPLVDPRADVQGAVVGRFVDDDPAVRACLDGGGHRLRLGSAAGRRPGSLQPSGEGDVERDGERGDPSRGGGKGEQGEAAPQGAGQRGAEPSDDAEPPHVRRYPTPRTVLIACGLSASRSFRRSRVRYWSSVLSLTWAPSGQAARSSSRRRTVVPGAAISAASRRNSVGVSATGWPLHRPGGGVRGRAGASASSTTRVRPGAAQRRADPGGEFGKVEGFREVVVAARGEAREPVGERVVRGEEDHRGLQPRRTHGLAHVPAVRVGQSDVEDDGIHPVVEGAQGAGPTGGGHDGEVLVAQSAGEHVAQPVVVLDDQDAALRKVRHGSRVLLSGARSPTVSLSSTGL